MWLPVLIVDNVIFLQVRHSAGLCVLHFLSRWEKYSRKIFTIFLARVSVPADAEQPVGDSLQGDGPVRHSSHGQEEARQEQAG